MKRSDLILFLSAVAPLLAEKKGEGSFARMKKSEVDKYIEITNNL